MRIRTFALAGVAATALTLCTAAAYADEPDPPPHPPHGGGVVYICKDGEVTTHRLSPEELRDGVRVFPDGKRVRVHPGRPEPGERGRVEVYRFPDGPPVVGAEPSDDVWFGGDPFECAIPEK